MTKETKDELSFVQKCTKAIKTGADFIWTKIKAVADWAKKNKAASVLIALGVVALAAIVSAVRAFNNSPYNSPAARQERRALHGNFRRNRNRALHDYAKSMQKANANFDRNRLEAELQLESSELDAEILLDQGLGENELAYPTV